MPGRRNPPPRAGSAPPAERCGTPARGWDRPRPRPPWYGSACRRRSRRAPARRSRHVRGHRASVPWMQRTAAATSSALSAPAAPSGNESVSSEPDAHVESGCGPRRYDLPGELAVPMPELRDTARDHPGNVSGLHRATVDLHEDAPDLVGERAVRKLLGGGRCWHPRLHRDARVPRGAGDTGPAELGDIHRYEVRRLAPGSDRRGSSERIGIDRRRGGQADRQTPNRGADRRDSGVTGTRPHRLGTGVIARMHVDLERPGPPDGDRVGGKLRRRLRHARVLRPRAATVQARLHRHLSRQPVARAARLRRSLPPPSPARRPLDPARHRSRASARPRPAARRPVPSRAPRRPGRGRGTRLGQAR